MTRVSLWRDHSTGLVRVDQKSKLTKWRQGSYVGRSMLSYIYSLCKRFGRTQMFELFDGLANASRVFHKFSGDLAGAATLHKMLLRRCCKVGSQMTLPGCCNIVQNAIAFVLQWLSHSAIALLLQHCASCRCVLCRNIAQNAIS